MLNKNVFSKQIHNLINKNILDDNLAISSKEYNEFSVNNNYFKQKYINTNQDIKKTRNMTLPIDTINKNLNLNNRNNSNNIRNRTQKNYDIKNINMYNYYKLNNKFRSPSLNTINTIKNVNSIDISNNNYYNKILNSRINDEYDEEYNLNNNNYYTQTGFYRPNNIRDNINQY